MEQFKDDLNPNVTATITVEKANGDIYKIEKDYKTGKETVTKVK